MRKLHINVFAAVLVLLVASLVQGAAINSYWQRMEDGFPNSVLVYEYVYTYDSPELEISTRIPQLAGTLDEDWQDEFNQKLRAELAEFIAEVKDRALARDLSIESQAFPYEGIVDFEVKLNQGGLLSIAMVSYTFTGGAHGMTYYTYLNLDLTTGRTIGFGDLFNSEVERERVAGIINAEIAATPERYFADALAPEQFEAEQGFYLQDTKAVICFGLYELAPYSSGIQEFAVPAP